MAPSEIIGWECGACIFTNKDCTCRDCQMCMSERPGQYAIVVGASESASARRRPSIVVSRCILPLLAATCLLAVALLLLGMSLMCFNGGLSSCPPSWSCGTVHICWVACRHARQCCWHKRQRPWSSVLPTLLLWHTGDGKSDGCVLCERLVFGEGRKEDVIAVYLCEHGLLTCKVGSLPVDYPRRNQFGKRRQGYPASKKNQKKHRRRNY